MCYGRENALTEKKNKFCGAHTYDDVCVHVCMWHWTSMSTLSWTYYTYQGACGDNLLHIHVHVHHRVEFNNVDVLNNNL